MSQELKSRATSVVPLGSAPSRLRTIPLMRETFAPFGDVIEIPRDRAGLTINRRSAEQFYGIAELDIVGAGGRPRISLVRCLKAAHFPLPLRVFERHALGSQSFVPLASARFVVVVAPYHADVFDWNAVRAFHTDGRQGINFRPGLWHHPLIALAASDVFLCIDREGARRDYQEIHLTDGPVLDYAPESV